MAMGPKTLSRKEPKKCQLKSGEVGGNEKDGAGLILADPDPTLQTIKMGLLVGGKKTAKKYGLEKNIPVSRPSGGAVLGVWDDGGPDHQPVDHGVDLGREGAEGGARRVKGGHTSLSSW